MRTDRRADHGVDAPALHLSLLPVLRAACNCLMTKTTLHTTFGLEHIDFGATRLGLVAFETI